MKTIMRGLTLAAVLLTGAVTQAEIVIDSFATALAIGTQNGISGSTVTTDRVVTVGNAAVTLNSGTKTFSFGNTGGGSPTNRWVNIAYSFSSPIDVHSFYNDIRFNYATTAAQFTVEFTGTSGATVAQLKPSAFAFANSNGTAVVSGSDFGDGGLLSNLTKLDIRITRSTNANNATFQILSSITAVPEPATMSLLGLTAIGGIFAHRRRKNQLAA